MRKEQTERETTNAMKVLCERIQMVISEMSRDKEINTEDVFGALTFAFASHLLVGHLAYDLDINEVEEAFIKNVDRYIEFNKEDCRRYVEERKTEFAAVMARVRKNYN